MTSFIDQPKSSRSNSQTANSVINQIHAIVDPVTSTLTSTVADLHRILLSSRAQLENTRTALSQTLQDFEINRTTESTDIHSNTNTAESRLLKQTNNLQQQIDRIDNRRRSLERALRQFYPTISTRIFTHETNTDDYGLNTSTDIEYESIIYSSNLSTASDSSLRSRKRRASSETLLDESGLVEDGSPDLADN